MPELPEVETVIRDLNKKIIGYQIVDFWSEWAKAIKGTDVKVFQKEVVGKKILKVRRIGKNIFIDLNQGKTIYIHLKMTGHLLLKYQNSNDKLKINSKSFPTC
jgi:formamidopyrimidine-DNA glycosylase